MLDQFETDPANRASYSRQSRLTWYRGSPRYEPTASPSEQPALNIRMLPVGRMCRKDSKHLPLVAVPEVKEAIPGQYATKPPAEGQGPHVSNDPLLIRHPGSAE